MAVQRHSNYLDQQTDNEKLLLRHDQHNLGSFEIQRDGQPRRLDEGHYSREKGGTVALSQHGTDLFRQHEKEPNYDPSTSGNIQTKAQTPQGTNSPVVYGQGLRFDSHVSTNTAAATPSSPRPDRLGEQRPIRDSIDSQSSLLSIIVCYEGIDEPDNLNRLSLDGHPPTTSKAEELTSVNYSFTLWAPSILEVDKIEDFPDTITSPGGTIYYQTTGEEPDPGCSGQEGSPIETREAGRFSDKRIRVAKDCS
ncbi:uncharacterized protein KY384_000026 [Bacidia gigantensis]|uniref:uncharacterized protein n=1 Tax=Bacidia gigantensis TaxID=2732470 RepID=UPI001D03CB70|nr:uncharacterized protein KY384_000026 [Bacidia gigantensis]KAG8526433.1 hypothetical protein KY384_000026 [Bacidia gigantensis]